MAKGIKIPSYKYRFSCIARLSLELLRHRRLMTSSKGWILGKIPTVRQSHPRMTAIQCRYFSYYKTIPIQNYRVRWLMSSRSFFLSQQFPGPDVGYWPWDRGWGNPIHFATFCDTSRLQSDRSNPKIDIFQFRKKFLNPCIPNFKHNKIEKNLRPNPGPPSPLKLLRLVLM